MREEFYAIIKLVSGEEVMSLVVVDEHNDESVLLLQDPIVMNMNSNQNMSYVKVKPWLELTEESIFLLTLDKIITMTECKDQKLIEIYNNFTTSEDKIENDQLLKNRKNGQVKPDSKMGYVSSVKDARKKLEELFKINQEPKES
tara:strand:- start:726 stop:1157 length:432 start_codon:yes stop_codon:yes gene_type:complete